MVENCSVLVILITFGFLSFGGKQHEIQDASYDIITTYTRYSKMAAIEVFLLFTRILALFTSFLNSKFERKFSLKRGNKGSFSSKQKNTEMAAILE